MSRKLKVKIQWCLTSEEKCNKQVHGSEQQFVHVYTFACDCLLSVMQTITNDSAETVHVDTVHADFDVTMVHIIVCYKCIFTTDYEVCLK